jgi:hypothetical protein
VARLLRARNLTEIPVPAWIEHSPSNHDRRRPASMMLEVFVDQLRCRKDIVIDEEANPASSEPGSVVQRLDANGRGRSRRRKREGGLRHSPRCARAILDENQLDRDRVSPTDQPRYQAANTPIAIGRRHDDAQLAHHEMRAWTRGRSLCRVRRSDSQQLL